MTSLSYTVGHGYPKLLWQTYYCGLVRGPHVEKQEVIPNSISGSVDFIVYTSLLTNVAAGGIIKVCGSRDGDPCYRPLIHVAYLCVWSTVFRRGSRNYEKATISFAMSVRPFVCPHATARLPLDGFS